MDEQIKSLGESLKVIEGNLDKKLAEHTAAIEKHGKASTELTGQVDKLSEKHAEVKAALDEISQKMAQGFSSRADEVKSVGKQFIESDAFEALSKREQKSVRVEVKNTISGLTGSPEDNGDTLVASDRLAGIVPGAFRSLNILDVIRKGATSSNIVEYTRESSWTNDAAETQEKGAKPESDLEFALVQENVRTVAHFIKASEQILADAPAVQSYINGRLIHGLRARLQSQILKGNGTAPNLDGLDQSGRHTAYTPATGDTALDSINKAKYAAIGSDFSVGAVFINPADWGSIERTKVTGGQYLGAGDNAITYIANGMVPVVWGLPVVMSNDVASGKFYAVDLNAFELFIRQGVTVEMGFVNADFTNNLVTIRAEMRAALAVYQPLAVRYGDLTV